MADATLNDLTTKVLQQLSVLQAGETVATEDQALVQSAITRVNEKLRDLEVAHWTDAAFPQSIVEDLSMYVACHVVGSYRAFSDAMAFRQANEREALANLRRLTASRERVDRPTRADYF